MFDGFTIWGILLSGWNYLEFKHVDATGSQLAGHLKSPFDLRSLNPTDGHPWPSVALSRVLRPGLKNSSEVTRHLASGGC